MTDLAPDVATKWIVVLNYNVAAHCVRQIEALLPLAGTGMFVVDNVSADDDFRTLEAACRAKGGCIVDAREVGVTAAQAAGREAVRGGARLVLFRNTANLGYSGGNNTALRLLHGLLGSVGAYLVINPDLIVTRESASQLLEAPRRSPARLSSSTTCRRSIPRATRSTSPPDS